MKPRRQVQRLILVLGVLLLGVGAVSFSGLGVEATARTLTRQLRLSWLAQQAGARFVGTLLPNADRVSRKNGGNAPNQRMNEGADGNADAVGNLLLPTLGNYPNTSVTAGGNVAVMPDAAPTGIVRATAMTSTAFKGTFAVNPTTGVVRITDAHPAGTYLVTVKGIDNTSAEVTKTFTLTVQTGPACDVIPVFRNGPNVSVGTSPRALAVGDFNSDGKQDLAIANSNSDSVSIRLGDGQGGFTSVPEVSVGFSPVSIAVGDFNEDGKPDFITTGGSISIGLGDGAGGFTVTVLGTDAFLGSVALGDFNGDGKLDFAVPMVAIPLKVLIRLGDGQGGFSNAPDLSDFNVPYAIAVGDFNGDEKHDLAIANHNVSPVIYLRLGNGTGGFSNAADVIPGTDQLWSIAVGDFNGDGKQDLAAGAGSRIYIQLGDGQGGFNAGVTLTPIQQSTSMAIGDFNGDGKQDFVSAFPAPNAAGLYLGDGLGNFSANSNIGVGALPWGIAAGDFDGDGRLDFATANINDNNVSVRLGGCPPVIMPAATLNRVQGSAAINSTIATVSNVMAGTLTVQATTVPTGISVTNIVNSGGTVTADVAAGCTVTLGNNTVVLTVTNATTGLSSTANLTVFVTGATADHLAFSVQPSNAQTGATISPPVNVRIFDQCNVLVNTTASISLAIDANPGGGTLTGGGARAAVAGTATFSGLSINRAGVGYTLAASSSGLTGVTSNPFTISCPNISVTPPAVTTGNLNMSFSQSFTRSGGAAPVSFTLNSGTLPTGLSLATNGLLSGLPTQAGSFPITVKVTDANNCMGVSATYTLTIIAPPTIISTGPLSRMQGSPASNSTIATVSDSNAGTLTVQATNIPAGISVTNILNSGGTVTADVQASCAATVGNRTVALTVTNSTTGLSSMANLTVNVSANPAPMLSYNAASVSASGSMTVNAATASDNGSITGYSIGSVAPAMTTAPTVNTSGAVFINSAGPAGDHIITVRATDNCGATTDASFTLTVTCQTITVVPTTLSSATTGASFIQQFTQSGGLGAITWSLIGATPPGLIFTAATATLSGAPTQSGSFSFTIRATDANGCFGERQYTLGVDCASVTVNPTNSMLPGSSAGSPYSQSFTATGGASPYTFTLSAGNLPTGLNLSGGGLLDGSPTGFGNFSFTVRATDQNGCFGERQYSLRICGIISLTASLPGGTTGTPYNQTITASGGAQPYAFAVSGGNVPPGLSLASDGTLSGTPSQNGSFTFAITVTDNLTCTGTQSYTVNIGCQTVTITQTSLPNGFVGTNYNQSLMAAGGTAPYGFTVSTGKLPGGLALARGGALTGTPTANGTFTFTVQATDANGCFGEQSFTVFISGAGLMFYPLPSPVRLLDTRTGFSGCTTGIGALAADSTRTQAARTACSTIPANATAIIGNITVVPSAGGYLTLFPSDAAQPTVANSNFTAGEVTNNFFTVGLGTSGADAGAFKIFTSATTDVIIDLTGYYAPPATSGGNGLFYHPLPSPVRLVETRAGQSGCFQPPQLQGTNDPNANPALDLQVQGRSPSLPSPCNSIPNDAIVLVGNATTVFPNAPFGAGYLTIYPSDAARPTVASSNYASGDVINGPFAVKLGTDGKFKVYTFSTTDLVVDITGYYSASAADSSGAGLLFSPLAKPMRLLETRPDFPGFPLTGCYRTNAPIAGLPNLRTQPVWGTCSDQPLTIPNSARAIAGNVTVINPAAAGFLTFFPGDVATAPTVATSNYPSPVTFGYNRHYYVGLSPANGTFKGLTQFTTDLIVDVAGYFAP